MTQLRIVHAADQHVEVLWGELPLARYVHRPDVPQLESPKPYLHPVRTLAGDVVTAYRPDDHVWHKGISLALPHVGTENFWGGPTWVRGSGYQQLANNGSMDHVEFEALEEAGDRALITERLAWHTQAGAHWIDERRTLEFSVRGDDWVLRHASELVNRSGQALVFGSPTTNGRPDAGYGGVLWRGPRSFTGGRVLGATMGAKSPSVAFVGESTLTFAADTTWFVRSTPFPVVGTAPFFHAEQTLGDGETMTLACDITVGA